MWFAPKNINSAEFELVIKSQIGFTGKISELEARIANLEDQLKRLRARYYREKPEEITEKPAEKPAQDLNTFTPRYI